MGEKLRFQNNLQSFIKFAYSLHKNGTFKFSQRYIKFYCDFYYEMAFSRFSKSGRNDENISAKL